MGTPGSLPPLPTLTPQTFSLELTSLSGSYARVQLFPCDILLEGKLLGYGLEYFIYVLFLPGK